MCATCCTVDQLSSAPSARWWASALSGVRNSSTIMATLGIGFWVGFLIVPTQVLLQEETPKEMLGRVSSSLMSVMSLSQVLAMSGAGPIAEAIGIRSLCYLSAALLLAIAAFGYPRIPKHA